MKKLLHFMLLLFVIGISNAQTPVHRFNFENNLQNTANNLTLTGANITYEAGRNASAGQAMVINNNASSNSYIDTTINGLSTTGGAFSVCFWAKLNTNTRVGYENRYISIGTNTTVSGVNRGFTFWQDRNNNFDRFAVNCGAGAFPAAQFLSSPATTWNFFTLVYDGSGTVKLYRNGTLESTTTTATNITLGNLILKMGRWNDTVYDAIITSSYSMDDLQLFSVALTDAQVATIYLPAQVPVISAVSSSPIGTTTATINYIINAGGAATTPIIRYGLSSTTLNNSQTGAVVNGSTTIAQDVNLTGLTAGTTYFYRVEASNLVGSATPSSTLSFATTVATIVPVISSVSSSSVTVNAATINYSINAGGAATTPVLRYGLTAANLNLNQTGTVANGTTATAMSTGLTGLTSGTTYFYRVEASNSAGSATPSSTLSFTTTAATPAPAITNLSPSNITFNSATINFNLNAFGSATTYLVEYQEDFTGAIQTATGGTTSVNSATAFQVQLTNLRARYSLYYFRVKATNATGQITFSNWVNFATPTPIILTNLNDNNVTSTSAQINYTLNTNGYSAFVEIRYQAGTFFDSDNPFTTRVITSAVTNSTATNYNYILTGLTPNTTYSYQFGAVTSGLGGVETGENAAFTTATLGTETTNNILSFSIYPNPVSSILNIEIASEIKFVEIYSFLGQKVLTAKDKQLNISNLSAGAYMIKVENADGAIATQKFVKK